MTVDKVLEVIEIYRKRFEKMGIDKADYPHDELLENTYMGLEHCYSMLDKMVEFVREGRMEKAFRWLGFIQGILWVEQEYTLTDLQNHNRPTEVTSQ